MKNYRKRHVTSLYLTEEGDERGGKICQFTILQVFKRYGYLSIQVQVIQTELFVMDKTF